MPILNHCLTSAVQIHSPNQDDRPTSEVSLLVIHGISLPAGQFDGEYVEALFTNTIDTSLPGLAELEDVHVSSHLYIRRDGRLIQFVPFDRRAWHAGQSNFYGRARCNDFAIGIELEGTDDSAYEPEQYEVLIEVSAELMNHYDIRDVVGHCHISPGRKTDPGEQFDWEMFKRGLAHQL